MCNAKLFFSAVEGRDCQALLEDGDGLDPGDPGDAVAACSAAGLVLLGQHFICKPA